MIAFILILILFLPQVGQASYLSDLASKLTAGTITQMDTTDTGFLYTAACDGAQYYIMAIECAGAADYSNQFTQHAAWDSVNHVLYFTGDAHLSGSPPPPSTTNPVAGFTNNRAFKYDAATNHWSIFTKMDPSFGNHADDNQAFNTYNGKFYWHSSATVSTLEYNPATDTWTTIPNMASPVQSTSALVFYPELGRKGSLIYVDGDWGVRKFDFDSNAWSTIIDTNGSGAGWPSAAYMGSVNVLAEYNPFSKTVMLGGGNQSFRGPTFDNTFYILHRDATLTQVATAPCEIGLNVIPDGALLVPDPTTGNYLAFCGSTQTVYEYVTATNTWRTASVTVPFWTLGNDHLRSTFFTAIPEYGSIMFVTYKSNASFVHLMKGLGSTTFASRCAVTGVLKCNGFDSSPDLGAVAVVTGVPTAIFHNNQTTCNTTANDHCPTIDTTIKADGTGSMKLVVGAGLGGDDAGQFYTNFSDSYVLYGAGSDLWVSWRERFDNNYVSAAQGGITMKQGMITRGFDPGIDYWAHSCTNLEVVSQNNAPGFGVPQLYQNCGRYAPIEGTVNGSGENSQYSTPDFRIQNIRPDPGCWHYAPDFAHRVPPLGSCIPFVAGEWMSFKLHIHTGPLVTPCYDATHYCFQASKIEEWVGREGSTLVKTIDGNVDIGPMSAEEKYGSMWFLPYSTAQTYPNGGTTWVDDLIISTQDIPDPVAFFSSNPLPPPSTPSAMKVSGKLKVNGTAKIGTGS